MYVSHLFAKFEGNTLHLTLYREFRRKTNSEDSTRWLLTMSKTKYKYTLLFLIFHKWMDRIRDKYCTILYDQISQMSNFEINICMIHFLKKLLDMIWEIGLSIYAHFLHYLQFVWQINYYQVWLNPMWPAQKCYWGLSVIFYKDLANFQLENSQIIWFRWMLWVNLYTS